MPSQPLQVDENPMRAVGQLLSMALLASVAMQETIKLMDIPPNKWSIRNQAKMHAEDVEDAVTKLLQEHGEVCAALKEVGY